MRRSVLLLGAGVVIGALALAIWLAARGDGEPEPSQTITIDERPVSSVA